MRISCFIVLILISGCSQSRYFRIVDADEIHAVTVKAPSGWVPDPGSTQKSYVALIRDAEPKVYPRPFISVAREDIEFKIPPHSTSQERESLIADQYVSGMRSRGYTNVRMIVYQRLTSATGREFYTYVESSNMRRLMAFTIEGDEVYTITLGADSSEIFDYRHTFHEVLDTIRFNTKPTEQADDCVRDKD